MTRGVEAGRSTVRELAAVHGCPPGCPACAAEAALEGVPAPLEDFRRLVASNGTMRLATLCKRSGRPFPQVTPDPVTQFCVEEAVFERLEVMQTRLGANGPVRTLEGIGNGDPALEEALARARNFARTGES